jgi:membrane protein
LKTGIANRVTVKFLLRLWGNLQQDYLSLISAGIAFYFLLAAFPAIGALISLYGLFSDPSFVASQMEALGRFLPPAAIAILSDQAKSVASSNARILGLGFFISIGLAIYSATKGVNALIQGLNIAYNEKEKRNLVRLNFTAFLLTFVMLVYFLVSLSLIALLPILVKSMALPAFIVTFVQLARWPLLFLMAIIGLEILYCYGPSRKGPRWNSISYGSLLATLLWLGLSAAFSFLVTHFGTYNETYGSLSAVIVLLLWFWLSALMILTGAEINATIEQYLQDLAG